MSNQACILLQSPLAPAVRMEAEDDALLETINGAATDALSLSRRQLESSRGEKNDMTLHAVLQRVMYVLKITMDPGNSHLILNNEDVIIRMIERVQMLCDFFVEGPQDVYTFYTHNPSFLAWARAFVRRNTPVVNAVSDRTTDENLQQLLSSASTSCDKFLSKMSRIRSARLRKLYIQRHVPSPSPRVHDGFAVPGTIRSNIRCRSCGRNHAPLACGGCAGIRYCTSVCARAHWDGDHHRVCTNHLQSE